MEPAAPRRVSEGQAGDRLSLRSPLLTRQHHKPTHIIRDMEERLWGSRGFVQPQATLILNVLSVM